MTSCRLGVDGKRGPSADNADDQLVEAYVTSPELCFGLPGSEDTAGITR